MEGGPSRAAFLLVRPRQRVRELRSFDTDLPDLPDALTRLVDAQASMPPEPYQHESEEQQTGKWKLKVGKIEPNQESLWRPDSSQGEQLFWRQSCLIISTQTAIRRVQGYLRDQVVIALGSSEYGSDHPQPNPLKKNKPPNCKTPVKTRATASRNECRYRLSPTTADEPQATRTTIERVMGPQLIAR